MQCHNMAKNKKVVIVVVGVVVAFFVKIKAAFDFSKAAIFGGQRGIRTLDTLLTYTRVPVVIYDIQKRHKIGIFRVFWGI